MVVRLCVGWSDAIVGYFNVTWGEILTTDTAVRMCWVYILIFESGTSLIWSISAGHSAGNVFTWVEIETNAFEYRATCAHNCCELQPGSAVLGLKWVWCAIAWQFSYRHRVLCCVFWYNLVVNHMLITKWGSFWSDFYAHYLRDAGRRGSVQITGAKRSGRGPGAWLCCLCLCLSQ